MKFLTSCSTSLEAALETARDATLEWQPETSNALSVTETSRYSDYDCVSRPIAQSLILFFGWESTYILITSQCTKGLSPQQIRPMTKEQFRSMRSLCF